MPFTPVQELPEGSPSVRIFLTGQLILQPNDTSDTCEVFVNRSAPNHHLTIEVREKFAGEPDFILMRHHGPLEFYDPDDLVSGLEISRERPENSTEPPSKVAKYNGPPTPYGEALNLAIDLTRQGFHAGKKLPIDHQCARPSIMIKDGIFHTAAKTSENIEVKLKKGEKAVRDLPAFASVIGANIYLKEGEKLHIAWREMGMSRTLSLKKPAAGVSYEVYIINDPLYDDPEEAIAHDEFAEYYKILPSVNTADRLKLEVKVLAPVPDDPRGSARTPCMPVVVGGGD